eukprot:CAMPEP_0118674206 /NCGR_PEP_ID=MMETSP0800-20121206/761_1 /TAXON_ID=210618 ORGANISM="Striatella unipunctata, Strain CCMP2910" /NCGR_SAMPLE_ID=MMETSP0800 /ASSEMBLY_ACC=CAM_ASM_000638 /LENGTH=911 /DNA_ID=CAMNT_0006569379 /DNA_START=171 /DNA_END=2906 /DNA_ORIENTATION=+
MRLEEFEALTPVSPVVDELGASRHGSRHSSSSGVDRGTLDDLLGISESSGRISDGEQQTNVVPRKTFSTRAFIESAFLSMEDVEPEVYEPEARKNPESLVHPKPATKPSVPSQNIPRRLKGIVITEPDDDSIVANPPGNEINGRVPSVQSTNIQRVQQFNIANNPPQAPPAPVPPVIERPTPPNIVYETDNIQDEETGQDEWNGAPRKNSFRSPNRTSSEGRLFRRMESLPPLDERRSLETIQDDEPSEQESRPTNQELALIKGSSLRVVSRTNVPSVVRVSGDDKSHTRLLRKSSNVSTASNRSITSVEFDRRTSTISAITMDGIGDLEPGEAEPGIALTNIPSRTKISSSINRSESGKHRFSNDTVQPGAVHAGGLDRRDHISLGEASSASVVKAREQKLVAELQQMDGFGQEHSNVYPKEIDHRAMLASSMRTSGTHTDIEEIAGEKELKCGRSMCLLCTFLFILVVGVISVPVFSLSKGGGSIKPTQQSYESVLDQVTDRDAFSDPSSPQSQALNWIMHTDPLELIPSSPNLLQRYALMVLYFTTAGVRWKFAEEEWVESSLKECDWEFVTCTGDEVTHVEIEDAFVEGVIPDEMVALTGLKSLSMRKNRLTGTLPRVVFELTSLEKLDLSDNTFISTIPNDIGNLINLKFLDVSLNGITGTLPSSLGKLVDLTNLSAELNRLQGSFLDFLVQLSNLEVINLARNDLTGSFPSGIGALSQLSDLDISTNDLRGTIPTQFGQLSSLRRLVVYANRLNGTLPTHLGNLNNLETLDLHLNRLTGNLTDLFDNLSLLSRIRLDQNLFTGTIPQSLGDCEKLTTLNIHDNRLEGTVPTLFGNLKGLKFIDLSDNKLEGTIPTELGSLPFLYSFGAYSNNFVPPEPKEVCALNLSHYQTDCDDIDCSCCTRCF